MTIIIYIFKLMCHTVSSFFAFLSVIVFTLPVKLAGAQSLTVRGNVGIIC